MRILMLLASAMTVASCSAATVAPHADLAQAASRFATNVNEQGIWKAFRAAITADAVILAPKPDHARHWLDYQSDVPAPAMSMSAPMAAESACSGDLGWTMSLVRISDAEGAPDYGAFLNIWRRDDGSWRVVVSQSIDLEDPLTPPTTTAMPDGCASMPDGDAAALQTAKLAFMTAMMQDVSKAYARWGAPDLRLYRDGMHLDASRQSLLANGLRARDMIGKSGGISRDRRLAYDYGTIEWRRDDNSGETYKSYWLRVWRLTPQGWRIAVDQLSPADPLSAP